MSEDTPLGSSNGDGSGSSRQDRKSDLLKVSTPVASAGGRGFGEDLDSATGGSSVSATQWSRVVSPHDVASLRQGIKAEGRAMGSGETRRTAQGAIKYNANAGAGAAGSRKLQQQFRRARSLEDDDEEEEEQEGEKGAADAKAEAGGADGDNEAEGEEEEEEEVEDDYDGGDDEYDLGDEEGLDDTIEAMPGVDGAGGAPYIAVHLQLQTMGQNPPRKEDVDLDDLPKNALLRGVMEPFVPHIRFPTMSNVEIRKVEAFDVVSEKVLLKALYYISDPQSVEKDPTDVLYIPRLKLFRFPPITDAKDVHVVNDLTFVNESVANEGSLTVLNPLKFVKERRITTFEVKLDSLPFTTPQKGFYGVGILDHKLTGSSINEGITSKQNGTLYYSNGWISSYGNTLDKTGNVPSFDAGDRVGFIIDFFACTLQFTRNGTTSGSPVPLHSGFMSDSSTIYAVVRLKSRSQCTIIN